MNKIIFLVLVMFFFTFVNVSFAQGKVTPMKGSLLVDPSELGDATQSENATSTGAGIASISILGYSPEITGPDGVVKKISSLEDLKNGGEINMGAGSAMVINFKDGSEVTLSNLSILDIEARLFSDAIDQTGEIIDKTLNAAENDFNLLQGKLKASIIKRFGQKFNARTPEIICSVKGTDFIITRDPEKKVSNVYLYEGIVDVDNLHGSTTELLAGNTIAVDSSGQMNFGKLSQDEWNQLSNDIQSTTTPDQTKQSSGVSWVGLIIGLICIVGLGVFIYKRKS